MLIVAYQDLRGEVERVAKFLNKSLSKETTTKLVEHLKFSNIAKNDSVNFEVGKKMGFMNEDGNFIRKGKVIWPLFIVCYLYSVCGDSFER